MFVTHFWGGLVHFSFEFSFGSTLGQNKHIFPFTFRLKIDHGNPPGIDSMTGQSGQNEQGLSKKLRGGLGMTISDID